VGAALAALAFDTAPAGSFPIPGVAKYPFIEARHYTRTSGRAIDLIVIHTMEAPEKPGSAEGVARWFAGPTAPEASAHYCIDSNSIVQCVRDSDVAWHAPGANHDSIGFEHAGFARQTARDWTDEYSDAMLRLSARLAAEKCREYRIPVVWLSAGDLRAGRRGITGHHDVSVAFRRSNHWDPSPAFPVEPYLAMVRASVGDHAAVRPEKTGPRTLRRGDRGWLVKRLQRLLRAARHDPGPIDGIFGGQTESAVRSFQTARGLEVDGIVGPATWKALRRGRP
jgi:N-acetyl-anhydromuramyl-L-alanine amidase AmpD